MSARRWSATGYLRGEGDGPNPGLSEAIARYQADNDLVPNGRVDFDLYYRLLATDRSPNARPPQHGGLPPRWRSVTSRARAAAGGPRLVAEHAPRPQAKLSRRRDDGVSPCSRPRTLMSIASIRMPRARLPASSPIASSPIRSCTPAHRSRSLPPGTKSFAIRFDKPGGTEAVACLGADREVGLRLPDKLKAQDLEPLPVTGLDDVASQFRGLHGARVDDARLAVEVMR